MRAAMILAAGLLLAAAGCDRPDRDAEAPAPARAAFSHDLPEDVSGYYVPVTEVRVDNWRLHHLFMGQVPEFIAWEAGQRTAGFAPVMIEFEDMAGPPVATDAGERRRRLRLIPAAYAVTEDRVRIEALSGGLGAVSFEGKLDQDALSHARRNLGDEGAVVTGRLKVGNRTFDGVSMRWWAGD
ncbi:hypothetical protein E3U41_07275 [Brevundimonas naejangsanensis]|nr:hypothetical protein E3U41_07275 [Brevundimonas naejangsanensis]